MIYLDNSATTKPYEEVLQSYNRVSLDYFGNPSSLHGLGTKAEMLLQQARIQISQLLKVKATEIFFTSGGTEGNNIAIVGSAWKRRTRGKHIITTEIEHASVYNTCKQLEKNGFDVTYLPVDETGKVSVESVRNNLRPETILVSIMHVNNEVGTIQPIVEIGKLLQEFPKVLFHVDNVQGVGKVPLDIYDAAIDLYTISAHKFHGLKGIGMLYVREGLEIQPLFQGGDQEWKLRSGTENVAGIVAMAKALRLTLVNQSEKVESLIVRRNTIMDELKRVEGISIHTSIEHSAPHIVNFSIRGFKAEVLVHALEENNVFISTTSACSSKRKDVSRTLLAMGIHRAEAESAVRLSLSYENTVDEIHEALAAIKDTVIRLRKVMR